MPSQPTPKPPATVRLAELTPYPVEADASRRDAQRVVNENLRAAERFALTGAPVSPDAAIAAIESGLAQAPAMVPQPVQQAQGRHVAGGITLTERQVDALRAARDKGGAIHVRGSRAGGATRRMCERLAVSGLVFDYPPFPLTESGREALAALDPASAMVSQPVQQQAKARETTAQWAARMKAKHPTPAPRPVREDSPAMKAALATAAEAGRRYGEAQNAVRAELDIAAAPARAGRYGKAA